MPRSRRNLQWIGCSALALAACADDARGTGANPRPGEPPQCLVGEGDSAIPSRADGLAVSQRRLRRHPSASLQ
ncbi:hypothetical protein FZ025_16245 [Xanthomonas hyacinthi]|uniref:Lipoprotein n=1 Tax=Xanthomonas hyacinthi TaxID=56455 RepID=A0A2S7ERI9_9XANT|nr:hypothetical protein [Xanthomonas hyacinthi]PPU95696.1 hypothetical protein XhyaCFBP1156_18115 [Xanthomonas hyacinthi]QGY78107.1 hypothetical protein FZ025_16245 [Xanthomonas hyacinthi]